VTILYSIMQILLKITIILYDENVCKETNTKFRVHRHKNRVRFNNDIMSEKECIETTSKSISSY